MDRIIVLLVTFFCCIHVLNSETIFCNLELFYNKIFSDNLYIFIGTILGSW